MTKHLIRLAAVAAFAGIAGAQAPPALPNLTAAPSAVSFTYTLGATQLPAPQTVTLKDSANAKLDFTITVTPPSPWLVVTASARKTPASLAVRVNPTSLAVGEHTAGIVITSAGAANSPITIAVSLTVKNPPPTVNISPSALAFNFVTDQGTAVPDQTLSIGTSGEPVSFTASVAGAAWLTLTPASGISLLGSPQAVKVSANPAGLLPGTYTAKITIATSANAKKPATVSATLTIAPGQAVLDSVWPPDVAVGSPDTTVTLFGTHLFPASVVHVGTVDVHTTWVDSSTLLAVIPSDLLSAQGTLAITITNAPQPPSNPLNWNVTPPGPRIWAVVNAASFVSKPSPVIAPGEIVSIFGSHLGPDDPLVAPAPAPGGAYPTTLGTAPAETQVEVEVTPGNWVAAPLIFAQEGQVNAVIPFNMTPATGMKLRLSYNGVTSPAFSVDGVDSDPAIFTVDSTGKGQAAVLNYDSGTDTYSLNSAKNPALKGSIVSIYATGGGQTTPLPTPEGRVIPLGAPPTLNAVTTVTFGTDTVAADYAGAVPGSIAGLVQINATIPNTVPAGKTVPILVTIGGNTSQAGVTIAVK